MLGVIISDSTVPLKDEEKWNHIKTTKYKRGAQVFRLRKRTAVMSATAQLLI